MAERDDKIPAMLQLLAPDGYYKYLGVSKVPPPPNNSSSTDGFIPTIDEEKVKKNYRRLSLKHHPDRPTGDAETFRVLKRARNVLLHSKLRQQYDLLGLDLDDDEDDEDDNGGGQQDSSDDGDGNNDGDSSKPSDESSGPESVLSQMASMALATLFQVIVRTVMMGLAAILVSRYRLLLFPAIGFLCFVAYRVQSIASQGGNPAASTMDMISPLMIGVGLVLMNRSLAKSNEWTWTYWIGESLVMSMFVFNSLTIQKSTMIAGAVALFSFLMTLWLRGRFWSYATLVGLEVLLTALVSLAFPIMDMILEQIMNEKLRKIGEKVRAHAQRTHEYYSSR